MPLGGHGDVAWNGIEALDWLHGFTSPFYVYHLYAPEPVIIYLTGLAIRVFGPTFFAARFVTALASALVIPVGFVAALLLGNGGRGEVVSGDAGSVARTGRRTAWLFALAYAVSFYPIILSKTGQRAQVFPLLVVMLLALFAHAWRSSKWGAFGAAAAVMAVANYTYIPARLMPALIGVWVGYEFLARGRESPATEPDSGGASPMPAPTVRLQFRARIVQVGGMLGITALLIAPQLVMYLRTPEAFFARSSQAAGQLIFQTGLSGADLWLALGRKLIGEFAIFVLPWRGAYAEMGHPLLELPLALGAILAAIFAFQRFQDRALWWPLLGIPVMFLTDVVSGTQSEPHGLRMIGVLPLAFLLAARGLALGWEYVEQRTGAAQPAVRGRSPLPVALAAILIVLPGLLGFWRYHWRYIPAQRADPQTTNRLEAADVFLAEMILRHADEGIPILITLDDFTRPNVTYLLSQAYPVRRSALRADGTLDVPAGGAVWAAIPADPFRPRHDGLVPEHDWRAWVMLVDGEMRLLPPMTAPSTLQARGGESIDLARDWLGSEVAWLQRLDLGEAAFDTPIQAVGANLSGEVELAGYTVDPQTLIPGDPLWITLYWRALAGASEDYETFVQVIDANGQAVAQAHRWTFSGVYRTRRWRSDELIPARLMLNLPPDLPPGPYTLIAGLYRVLANEPLPVIDEAGNPIAPHATISGFKVALPEAAITQPAPDEPIQFAEAIALAGVSVEPGGATLALHLDWQAIQRPEVDATLFVHVVNQAGETVAQFDGRPRNGAYPTNIWDAGEVVPDEIAIPLPADLPAGRYRVYIGWYTLPDVARLTATLGGEPVADDRVPLVEFTWP